MSISPTRLVDFLRTTRKMVRFILNLLHQTSSNSRRLDGCWCVGDVAFELFR
jgi:hypothetical protein